MTTTKTLTTSQIQARARARGSKAPNELHELANGVLNTSYRTSVYDAFVDAYAAWCGR